ncbi:MAG: hypothetical protein RQ763_08685 [Sulfurimonas sp.]|uniref:hypothetical protein n=1 Tax=Sulfurimonas sp. TaxID=2022749 RepID=UPI0028CEE27B|nr:hypothetical protein [Sulfurimonas sp.]MDT8339261.1 hypothetical protein [Sulfurimonas sp.]
MAGVHFGFDNFRQLLDLSIGLAQRLDESRAESFTLLYCDFSAVEQSVIDSSLEQILRNSDAIVNSKFEYFFLLPYTDKYGAKIVKNMFEEFFARDLNSSMVSYPVDGESSRALVEELANNISATYKKDLKCLESFNLY